LSDNFGEPVGTPPLPVFGSEVTSLSVTHEYTITCTGLDGSPVAASTRVPVYAWVDGVLKEILPQ
jgi:hypothetical protein